MTLSSQNIQDLYKFTRQHYVEHFDVQTELVDHLANDIEEIWVEKPHLTFEQARDISFKKFGIFGFMDVVEKKQNQMMKRYYKIVLKLIKEWFKLPKIVLTMLLTLVFYKLQEVPYAYHIYMTICFSVLGFELFKMWSSYQKIKKKEKETGKRWMFEQIIQSAGMGNTALITYYFIEFSIPKNEDLLLMSEPRRIFTALLLVFFILIAYIILVVIPKKAEELLEETYPEYKIANSL